MRKLSEEEGRHAVAVVLRYGSLVSTLIMALGLSLLLARGGAPALTAAYSIRSEILFLKLLRCDPPAVIELGILLLLFTPIFRVVVAALSFALERDTKYVLISVGVLSVILLSIGFAIRS